MLKPCDLAVRVVNSRCNHAGGMCGVWRTDIVYTLSIVPYMLKRSINSTSECEKKGKIPIWFFFSPIPKAGFQRNHVGPAPRITLV